jgi:dihydrofolate reductase
MGKTQYFTASSLDGFIADGDNSLGWLYEAHPSDHEEGRWEAFFGAVGAMAMGATTYRWALDAEHLLDQPEKWHEWYGDVPCWVFTHRELPTIPNADLTFVQGDVRPVHTEMTEAAGDRNVWLVGGGDLVGQFADHGLLDELLIHLAPVTLGAGAPLLPRRLTFPALKLVDVAAEGGFAYLTYEVSKPNPSRDRRKSMSPGK